MLFRRQQLRHLKPDGDGKYRFVDNGNVTEREKKDLLELDAAMFEIYEYHIITNLEDLKK